ncbi:MULTISPECIES: vWA domain-containing protein [unclassified Corallococcus]|uniref:vWA domain-containing protein n=1 Tax=unclassified Corallococcus TaxID=2685029 RepID=UPI001A8D1E7B|nr:MULTISPECIES: von Willebrand factor type A domain-containing protein [unclassified Corallococcus]MBN9685594.1 von Willebrand factor type A domain-containing protein [Corallococcus sp. NCSPR001]WAS82961.1 von Willebrand factor type A domain-containing protein [Corallococcus sp. NCRR]
MSPFFSKRRVSFVSGALLCASLAGACSSLEPAQGVSARNELKPQAVARTQSAPKDEDFATAQMAPPPPSTPAPAEARKKVREAAAPSPVADAEYDSAPSASLAAPPSEPAMRRAPGKVMAGAGGATAMGAVAPAPLQQPMEKSKRELTDDKSQVEGGNVFETYKANAFTETAKDNLSTFAADVDTASYSMARRYLQNGQLPPTQAVRVEEFVNYFKYRYTPPEEGAFTVHLEGAPSPFNARRQFVRVGVQGKVVSRSQRKPAHLVFLVDTSGSMASSDKLPLAIESIKVAVKNLNENDTVALVTYAGSTRDVLPPTPATDVKKIHAALDTLVAGGGTAMGSGMEAAYKHAVKKAAGGVVSRVVVLTDGDANIGPNLSPKQMLSSIEKYVAEGVTLTTVGFGMGNYHDSLMEQLADKGNGNSFYVDSMKEARKVFETQLTGTLEVIAKDVKFQVEFNPKAVSRYRLMGYENRDIADKDFRDDKVDAGEIGAGHTVTALYEVELTAEAPQELATVRIRAKAPNGTEAKEQAFPLTRANLKPSMDAASNDFRFAVAVAATADILRAAPAAEGWSLATTQKLAEGAVAGDSDRTEFVRLIGQARALTTASANGR